MFGRDYPTPDDTCIRDYVHVMDLCQAHLLAIGALMAGGGSDVFNLGNGDGFSVQEVIVAAGRVTGREIRVREAGRRAGDPARLVANSGKARAVLGWKPEFGELEAIVEHAWNWERKITGGPAALSSPL